jgi:hypothetical protein
LLEPIQELDDGIILLLDSKSKLNPWKIYSQHKVSIFS